MATVATVDRLALARRVIAALDLTELGDDADAERIEAVCRAAHTAHGDVAAVCIPPRHVALARRVLAGHGRTAIRVATVANFPEGDGPVADCVREVRIAVAEGADEVDVVFPWRALRAGNERLGHELVAACRAACGAARLKVILETGALHSHCLIRRASEVALAAGADFLKTSTGRIAAGASLDAAAVMLEVLAEHHADAGLKVSGGLRTLIQASAYLDLVDRRMGSDWARPERFRIGASRLLDEALATLGGPGAA